MRKLSKRFLAFLMAMVMALSCTAVASAAEVEADGEEVVIEGNYLAMTIENGELVISTVDSIPEDGISLHNNESTFNCFDGALKYNEAVSGSIFFPFSTGTIYAVCGVKGSVRLTVRTRNSYIFKDRNITNTTEGNYSSTITGGTEIIWNIISNGASERCILDLIATA